MLTAKGPVSEPALSGAKDNVLECLSAKGNKRQRAIQQGRNEIFPTLYGLYLERSNFVLRWHGNGNKTPCMKTKRFVLAMTMVSFGLCAHAQETYQTNAPARPAAGSLANNYANRLGVGLEFGAPIGVNAKYWLNNILALDGAVGWSPFSHSTAEIHGDFLIHNFNLISLPAGQTPVYIGIGLFGRLRDDGRSDVAGFRFPIGASYMFSSFPVDIFAEFAPEYIFAPFSRAGIDAAIGFRYYF